MAAVALVLIIALIAVVVAVGVIAGVFLAGMTLAGLTGVTASVLFRYRTPRPPRSLPR